MNGEFLHINTIKEIADLKTNNMELQKELYRVWNILDTAMEYIKEQKQDSDNWVDYELLIQPIVLEGILRGDKNEGN